jgi:hypothetical protein
MFRVYFVHVRSFAAAEFGNFDAALNHAQRRGFEAVIIDEAGERIAAWSTSGGLTRLRS